MQPKMNQTVVRVNFEGDFMKNIEAMKRKLGVVWNNNNGEMKFDVKITVDHKQPGLVSVLLLLFNNYLALMDCVMKSYYISKENKKKTEKKN